MYQENLSDKWFSAAMRIYREGNLVFGSGPFMNEVYMEVSKGYDVIEKTAKRLGTNRINLDEPGLLQEVQNVLAKNGGGQAAMKALGEIDREWML